MNFPVIFLDVDGVLNSRRWFKSSDHKLLKEKYCASNGYSDAEFLFYTHFEPKQVIRLKRILETTGAKIVLSSTWRLLDITRQTFFMLRLYIPNLDNIVVGMTPSGCGGRGREIEQWIKENKFSGPFVILDDDSDMEPHQKELVQTCFGNGMLQTHADEVIRRLTFG